MDAVDADGCYNRLPSAKVAQMLSTDGRVRGLTRETQRLQSRRVDGRDFRAVKREDEGDWEN